MGADIKACASQIDVGFRSLSCMKPYHSTVASARIGLMGIDIVCGLALRESA